MLDGIDENGNISEEARDSVDEVLRHSFRPEFLNRLDEIILFKPLTKGDILKIVDIIIDDLNKRLHDNDLSISLSDEAKRYCADMGYEPQFGARPLKRWIQKHVETLAARAILEESAISGSMISIDIENGELKAHIIK